MLPPFSGFPCLPAAINSSSRLHNLEKNIWQIISRSIFVRFWKIKNHYDQKIELVYLGTPAAVSAAVNPFRTAFIGLLNIWQIISRSIFVRFWKIKNHYDQESELIYLGTSSAVSAAVNPFRTAFIGILQVRKKGSMEM